MATLQSRPRARKPHRPCPAEAPARPVPDPLLDEAASLMRSMGFTSSDLPEWPRISSAMRARELEAAGQ